MPFIGSKKTLLNVVFRSVFSFCVSVFCVLRGRLQPHQFGYKKALNLLYQRLSAVMVEAMLTVVKSLICNFLQWEKSETAWIFRFSLNRFNWVTMLMGFT